LYIGNFMTFSTNRQKGKTTAYNIMFAKRRANVLNFYAFVGVFFTNKRSV